MKSDVSGALFSADITKEKAIDYILSNVLLTEIGISVLILLLFLGIRKWFVKYLFQFLASLTSKTNSTFDDELIHSFEKPFRFLIITIGLYLSINSISALDFFDKTLIKIFRTSIILCLTWGFLNLSSTSSFFFKRLSDKLNFQLENTFLSFVSKASRFVIIGLSISIIAQEWGYDFNGFIAGLGVGGLAIALAAKDTLGNLFAGIIILTEKPFQIGEWIKTPSVEGTVEDITFRSTKVRTFPNALVTIPNSTLANEAITNWTKMGKRQITFRLSVKNSTSPDKLKNSLHKIRTMLSEHEEVHKDTIFAQFDLIENGNYQIFLYFFTNTTVWGEYLTIKEDINFKIIEILDEENVKLAYPSQSIYVEKEENHKE